MSTIVFLGGGRITSALVSGLRAAKFPHTLVVHDRNRGKGAARRKNFGVEVEADWDHAVRQAALLVLAARPQAGPEILGRMRPTKTSAGVSGAAAIPTAIRRRLCSAPL